MVRSIFHIIQNLSQRGPIISIAVDSTILFHTVPPKFKLWKLSDKQWKRLGAGTGMQLESSTSTADEMSMCIRWSLAHE